MIFQISLASSCIVPQEHGDVPSGSELLNQFPVFESGGGGQIIFQDCSADNRVEFTYGHSANQPVIL